MNFITKLLIIILCFFLPALVAAQRSSAPAQAPQRDPQAIAILQQAVAAMASMETGFTLPSALRRTVCN